MSIIYAVCRVNEKKNIRGEVICFVHLREVVRDPHFVFVFCVLRFWHVLWGAPHLQHLRPFYALTRHKLTGKNQRFPSENVLRRKKKKVKRKNEPFYKYTVCICIYINIYTLFKSELVLVLQRQMYKILIQLSYIFWEQKYTVHKGTRP